MNIAIIGAGAIGGLVAAYLKSKNESVFLVGHSDSVTAIKARGLVVTGVRGPLKSEIDTAGNLLYKPDVAILATKTQDLESAVVENQQFLRNTLIVTTQNGVQADEIASQFLPRENIISSIVMFGATRLNPGEIVHNFEGSWIIGKPFMKNDAAVLEIGGILNKIFPTLVVEDIKGMKYLKIFVNANNCIAAVLGVSIQEAFSDRAISCISIALWKEGLRVVNKAGITLESLPDFPIERFLTLTSLPTPEAADIFSGIMKNLSREPLYGSILQSIKRGKPSEIDYINGEFSRLAKANNADAPLNEQLVEMVHSVERTNMFFSKEELLEHTKKFLN